MTKISIAKQIYALAEKNVGKGLNLNIYPEKVRDAAYKEKLEDAVLKIINAQSESFFDDKIFANLGKYFYIFSDKSAIFLHGCIENEVTLFEKTEKEKIKNLKTQLIKERDRPVDKFYNLGKNYSDSDFDLYF